MTLYKRIRMVERLSFFLRAWWALFRFGDQGLLLLLAWPGLLLVINPAWIYGNVGYFAGGFGDSWIYLGFFVNTREMLSLWSELYHSTRLGWIVPGHLAYAIFPPLVANLGLRLGLFYGALLGVYGTLALTVGRRAALLTALLMGSYSYFLQSVSWDYVDGICLAYFSLAMLFLTLAIRRQRSRLWLFLGGAVATAMLHCNLSDATLLPSLGVYYMGLKPRLPVRSVLRDITTVALGAVGITALLGAANVALGSTFFFFLPSLNFATHAMSLASNPWITTTADWPLRSPYLVWPALAFLAGVAGLVVPQARRRLGTNPPALLFIAVYLLAATAFLFLQLRGRGTPVLEISFYASHLIPAMFLALGALVAPLAASLSRARAAWVLAITGGVALAAFAVRSCGELPLTYPLIPALALGAASLLALRWRPGNVASFGLLIGALLVATPSAFRTYNSPEPCPLASRAAVRPSDQYLAVLDGVDTIRRYVPEQRVLFWYNKNEQPLYGMLNSTFLGPYSLLNQKFPATVSWRNDTDDHPLPPGSFVVLLSQRDDAPAEAERVLRVRGREAHLIGQERIQRGNVWFNLTLLQLAASPVPSDTSQTLYLTQRADPARFLRAGWSNPESWATWTDGRQAELELQFDRAPRSGTTLEFSVVSAMCPPQATMRVAVAVNGTRLDTWVFDQTRRSGTLSVVVPAAIAALSDRMRVVLDIDRPYSPYELGLSGDPRQLGLAVDSLKVVPGASERSSAEVGDAT